MGTATLRAVALAVILEATLAGAAAAQGHVRRMLAVEDGLVHSHVLSMGEDRDGFLWFGTADGASRFDGLAFTNFRSADGLPDGLVEAIYQDPDGPLYFGTTGGAAIYEQGRMRPLAPRPASAAEKPFYRAAAASPAASLKSFRDEGDPSQEGTSKGTRYEEVKNHDLFSSDRRAGHCGRHLSAGPLRGAGGQLLLPGCLVHAESVGRRCNLRRGHRKLREPPQQVPPKRAEFAKGWGLAGRRPPPATLTSKVAFSDEDAVDADL